MCIEGIRVIFGFIFDARTMDHHFFHSFARGPKMVTGDGVVVNNCVSRACYSFINVQCPSVYFIKFWIYFSLLFVFYSQHSVYSSGLVFSHHVLSSYSFHQCFFSFFKITNDTWTCFRLFKWRIDFCWFTKAHNPITKTTKNTTQRTTNPNEMKSKD